VFFFGGWQFYHREQLPTGALGNVPTDEHWPKGLAKFNWSISPTVKFEGFVEGDRDDITGNGAGPSTMPEATAVNQAPKIIWNDRLTWTPTRNALVEIRNGGLGYEQRIFPTPPGTIEGPAPHRDTATGITSGNVLTFRQLDEKRLVLAGSVTRHVEGFAAKNHELKSGVEYERTENKLYNGHPDGLQFNDLNGDPNQVEIWAGDRTDGVGGRTSIYAQDAWRMNDRVTI